MVRQNVVPTARDRLLSHVPVEERRIAVDGVSTSVLRGGEGPPLVLLHGGIQAGGAVWWRVLPSLVASHRVVVPDLPGLGESDPLSRLDAAAFDAWLDVVLAETCDEPPTLVAHSAPGGLAAGFAARHPGRLRRLVLVDSAGLGPFRPPPGFVAALIRTTVKPSPASFDAFMRRVVADLDNVRGADGEGWAALGADVVSRAGLPAVRKAMRQVVKAGTEQLTEPQLRRITAPTALVWGRHDPLLRLRVAEEASTMLGWPLRVVERAGHLPHVEQPHAFLQALSDVTAAG